MLSHLDTGKVWFKVRDGKTTQFVRQCLRREWSLVVRPESVDSGKICLFR